MLEILDLYKKYDKELFDGLNIGFPNKGFVLIKGSSGVGKSTLLNIILGLEKSDKGSVFFNGKEIEKEKDFLKLRKEQIGYIFQNYGLINYFTIKENFLVDGCQDINDALIERYLGKVNLSIELNTPVYKLSGGEKQRVAIARCLINNKKIILCDEPTGALDVNNAEQILTLLKEISKESLVICVSHDVIRMKKYVDYIYDLDLRKWDKEYSFNNEECEINIVDEKRISLANQMKLSFASINHYKVRTSLMITALSFLLSLFYLLSIFYMSFDTVLTQYVKRYINYNCLEISKENSKTINDTGFSFVSTSRPDKGELDYLLKEEDVYLKASFDHLFKEIYLINGEESKLINCKPVYYLENTDYQIENDLIKDMAYNDFFINEEAKKIINEKSLLKSESKIITYDKYSNKAIDYIKLEFELSVVKVVDEFSFLSAPTIYYSYQAMEDYIKNYRLDNASTLLKSDVSLFDRINSLSNDDEDISSYEYLLFTNKNDVLKIKNFLLENDYAVTSQPLMIYETIENIFSLCVSVFLTYLIFSFVIIIVLIITIVRSIIVDRRKEFAYLKVYGYSFLDVDNNVCFDNFFIMIISLILSILLFIYLSILVNFLIEKYLFISNIINFKNISNIAPILSIFIIVVIINFIICKVLLKSQHKKTIVSILKE